MRPEISVILPAYNCESTLRYAVGSILHQTEESWELIIVDDASSDGTGEVVRELAESDARISFVLSANNRGCAASLNIGAVRARADIIARMDGDDWSHPSRLEEQLERFSSDRELAVLGTCADLVDLAGNCKGVLNPPLSHCEILRSIHRASPFIHPSVMMRKRFLIAHGGYNESFVNAAEDYDLWLRGIGYGKYENLPERLFRYTCKSKVSWRQSRLTSLALLRAVCLKKIPVYRALHIIRPLAGATVRALSR